jgi:hypothetical protein
MAAALAACLPGVYGQSPLTPPALKKILKKFQEPSALDQYVEQAHKRAAPARSTTS